MQNRIKVGDKFNLLTVIKDLGMNRQKRHVYECQCDCGEIKKVSHTHLTRDKGATKSCGCSKNLLNSIAHFKGCGEIGSSFWINVKIKAEKRKIKFNITVEDMWNKFIEQNSKCKITGINLTFKKRARDNNGTASLDRIDNTKGYTKENIQWVHKRINQMKNNMTFNEFLYWSRLIMKNNENIEIDEGAEKVKMTSKIK